MRSACKTVASVLGAAVLLGLASCTTSDKAWERAVNVNTEEAIVVFARKYRESEYTPEIIKRLAPHAERRQRYAIPAIMPSRGAARTHTQARITKDVGDGRIFADGKIEWEFDPATGQLRSMFWNPGAVHTILCVLTVEEYTFLSDQDDPLVFETTEDQGYTYKRGAGIVIEPGDTLVSLGEGVRRAAVRKLTDQALLARIAVEDESWGKKGTGYFLGLDIDGAVGMLWACQGLHEGRRRVSLTTLSIVATGERRYSTTSATTRPSWSFWARLAGERRCEWSAVASCRITYTWCFGPRRPATCRVGCNG